MKFVVHGCRRVLDESFGFIRHSTSYGCLMPAKIRDALHAVRGWVGE